MNFALTAAFGVGVSKRSVCDGDNDVDDDDD